MFCRRPLPPGHTVLPLIGNLFAVGAKPHESLVNLAKKHGPLMTIRLGYQTSLVASSPKMAREVLQKHDEASGRTVPDTVTALEHYDVAVLFLNNASKHTKITKNFREK